MFDQSYSYLMYDEVDDYEWFIQEATDYIAAHPDCHHGYNNRAIAYFELGKLEKALDDFKLAIEIAQDQDIQPLKNRGHMFEQTNRLEFAICDYNSAIQLAPKNPYVRRARALAWMKKLDFMAAIEDFNVSIKYEPRMKQQYLERAKCYEKVGQDLLAKKDLKAARRL